MNVLTFLNHPDVAHLSAQYCATKAKKAQASYNMFTISSYNSYLENFHSDIIASLLNPTERHGQFTTFLHLFIEWLNKAHNTNINPSNFRNTIVTREQGRLDIWLRDEDSKQSIIIENKINNASDMDEQLDRYFNHVTARKYTTVAVAYLSLDGTKNAPPCNNVPEGILKNVAAYNATANDMVSGWLIPCFNASFMAEDSRSFIYQYIKLLEHLANKSMDNDTMESFYQFISVNNGIQAARSIVAMVDNLTSYRADRLVTAITNYAPFTKYFRYRPHYLLYERYRQGRHDLKLDLYFEDDGSATLVFWNTKVADLEGREVLTRKLTEMGRLNDFGGEPTYYGNGYLKKFEIGMDYADMNAVDKAFAAYVISFMQDLRTTEPYID